MAGPSNAPRGGEDEVDPLDPERSFAQTWHEPPPPPDIPEVLKNPPPGPRLPEPPGPSSLSGMGQAWGMAMDFIFTILAGAGLGWLIGRWQGHLTGWVLGGLSVGFAAALVRIIRATQRQERRDREAAEARRGGPKARP